MLTFLAGAMCGATLGAVVMGCLCARTRDRDEAAILTLTLELMRLRRRMRTKHELRQKTGCST